MALLEESCYCEDNMYVLKGACECEEDCVCECEICTSCGTNLDMWKIDLIGSDCGCTECTCQPKDEEWDCQP